MDLLSILLVLIVAFLVGVEGILDEFQFHQPLVACTLVGAVTGHLLEGLVLGGFLQMITLGWANVGAAVAPDAALASMTSAIIFVSGLEGGVHDFYGLLYTSILIAIPVSLVGLSLTKFCRTKAIEFVHHMDEGAKANDIATVEKWHILGIIMQGLRVVIVALVLCLIPGKVIAALFNSLPYAVVVGIECGGGMLSAVGYAIVINMMSNVANWPFFVIGFILAAISDLSIFALACMAIAFAIVYISLKYRGGSDNTTDPVDDILNDY